MMYEVAMRSIIFLNSLKKRDELQGDVKELTEKLGRFTLALVVLTIFLVFLTRFLLLRHLLL